MNIIVNGKTVPIEGSEVDYEAIVKIADDTGYPTVTYKGPKNGDSQRSGSMYFGCTPVRLEAGMIFNVIHTGNA